MGLISDDDDVLSGRENGVLGLNGVLINEDEKKRSFKIEALPSAQPIEQWIYVSGKIETRSPLASSYAASQPILLRVKPRTMASTASN